MAQGEHSYTGDANGLKKPSPWLCVDDLLEILKRSRGDDFTVTIVDVKRYGKVTFDEGREESNVGALCFKGKTKELTINATRRKSLVRLFGKHTKAWRDKCIALYVDPNVKMKGVKVGGIRIRPKVSQQRQRDH